MRAPNPAFRVCWHVAGSLILTDGRGNGQPIDVADTSRLHAYHVRALVAAARAVGAGHGRQDIVAYHTKWERDLREAIEAKAWWPRSKPVGLAVAA